ncbi:MAG: UDP-N-acetylmuramate--L-alanine ligase [Defluviitaleaceae bacterium]|nr:UDP-N-acetylmuramate--L-alanine ligase [Defluviitaleaceae bacterium]
MIKLDLSTYNHAHFIGIGGISMSGLAEILLLRGMKVSGSDVAETSITKHLKNLGITINEPQSAKNIQDGTDLVIYTAAVKKDNPEILESERRKLKIIDRAQLLGLLMEEYSCPICISGTHGKTTTTSMVSEIFLSADRNPTISCGGMVASINSSFHVGSKDAFIVESCEYFNSFLKFFPKIGVILNIDADHLDFFGGMRDLENAFRSFAKNIKSDGALIINNNIPNIEYVISELDCPVFTFGDKNADWYADDFDFGNTGLPEFSVFLHNKKLCRLKLNVPGMHNVMNSLAAFAAAYEYGLSPDEITAGLSLFKGTKRRYEFKGTFNGGAVIIDDYAHHPTEIEATLSTAKQISKGKVMCLFQPHTYSRTEKLFDGFAEALSIADEVFVLDIFAAREHDNKGVGSKDLADKINEKHAGKAKYFSTFLEAEKYFLKNCFPSDMLITMGAGDVNLVGESILST